MDNNAKRWFFITRTKTCWWLTFQCTVLINFFFQHWNLLIRSNVRFNAQRFAESTQCLEIFKRSSSLWGERSAQRSAVGNIIWLSMHPRISVVTKSSIRMAALHVSWYKISHQLWSSPTWSPQSLRESSSPMCSYWQPCYGQLTALKIDCDCIAGAGVQLIEKRRK